jgi:Tol biopolymer transport system component
MGITKRGELERFDLQKRAFSLYLPGVSAEGLAFTRDGSKIVYASLPEGNLWEAKSDGSDRRQLTFAPMRCGLPRWSPDGKQIAFIGTEPGKVGQIYLIPADGGGNPERLTEMEDGAGDPSWSPDGDAIAFGSTYGTAISSKLHPIQILNLKSRTMAALSGSDKYFSPRWSPDGRWILAVDGSSGALELFNVGTKRWEELTKSGSAYPDWAQDSRCIFFHGETPTSEMESPEYRICTNDRRPEAVANLAQIGEHAVRLWRLEWHRSRWLNPGGSRYQP